MPAALERSRSGKGGHIWIFFDRALPAITARKLGCVLLTRTMERRHQLGLDSYDRLFPNQDTMPSSPCLNRPISRVIGRISTYTQNGAIDVANRPRSRPRAPGDFLSLL